MCYKEQSVNSKGGRKGRKRGTKNEWDKKHDKLKPNHINNTLNISDMNTLKKQRLDKTRPKYMLLEINVL